jgi:carboxyl-terminal processing protease
MSHIYFKKYLILNLRNNRGGIFESCIKIARLLLPECTMLKAKHRNKTVEYTNTGINQIKFDKIFILINENTASCSEILCLMLQQLLDNVVVMGKKMYFKECGQHTISSRKYNYIFSITDFKWFINDKTSSDIKDIIYNKEELFDLDSCYRYILKLNNLDNKTCV